jgi:predicted Zn-dependent protease with MMP-like domain
MFPREPRHHAPTLRRILLSAAAALSLGLTAVALLQGFSASTLLRLLEAISVFLTGVMLLGSVVSLLLVRLAGWRQPEAEFEALVRRAEQLAVGDAAGELVPGEGLEDPDEAGVCGGRDADPFAVAVRAALEELPLEFHRALEHVAVVISAEGWRHRAYGMYQGDTVAQDHFHKRILIFRDTLIRDFGDDPERLQAQVTRTLRHELAHHLGWDERGVRGLGL